MVVYEMSRQVFPTAPSPTTTHLERNEVSQSQREEGAASIRRGRGRGHILDSSNDHVGPDE